MHAKHVTIACDGAPLGAEALRHWEAALVAAGVVHTWGTQGAGRAPYSRVFLMEPARAAAALLAVEVPVGMRHLEGEWCLGNSEGIVDGNVRTAVLAIVIALSPPPHPAPTKHASLTLTCSRSSFT